MIHSGSDLPSTRTMGTFALRAAMVLLLLSQLQIISRQVSASEIPRATSQLDVPGSLVFEGSLEVDPTMRESGNYSVAAGRSSPSANRKILQSGCQAHDISITQAEVDEHGIPQFNVQVLNTCVDRNCQIFNIVAACGEFSWGTFVNPNVFKRLDVAKGTCLVNNGKSMSSGAILVFSYSQNFIQPISLLSASVSCNTK